MKNIKHTLAATTLSVLSLAVFSPAQAGHEISGPGVYCVDFSSLATGIQYLNGGRFSTPVGDVEIRPARALDGTPIFLPPGGQFAEIINENIAFGVAPPEVHGYFVNLRFLPTVPVSSVSMHFAQNTGPDNQHLYSSLGINGKVVQLANGIGSADGLVLGNDVDGQVQVSTTLVAPVPPHSAQWISGTVTLNALNGAINAFMLGGVQYRLDDLCVTQ